MEMPFKNPLYKSSEKYTDTAPLLDRAVQAFIDRESEDYQVIETQKTDGVWYLFLKINKGVNSETYSQYKIGLLLRVRTVEKDIVMDMGITRQGDFSNAKLYFFKLDHSLSQYYLWKLIVRNKLNDEIFDTFKEILEEVSV